jgi:hypothetical protein
LATTHFTQIEGKFNGERSHAGPVVPDTPRYELPALAAATGSVVFSFVLSRNKTKSLYLLRSGGWKLVMGGSAAGKA